MGRPSVAAALPVDRGVGAGARGGDVGDALAAVRRRGFTGPFGLSRASECLVYFASTSRRLLPSGGGGRSLPRAIVSPTLAGFFLLDFSGLATWATVSRR